MTVNYNNLQIVDMEDVNKTAYKAMDVVDYYLKNEQLQAPEANIVDLLKDQLPHMSMLDIGVGGGRTTLHFANLVNKYVGVDYSEEMIEVCNDRFGQLGDNVSFQVCDARCLKDFADNEFDFVLFSFNGIDYMSHDDREVALNEIIRVLKPSGYFCFSTHNLQAIHKLFSLKEVLAFNPRKLARNLLNKYRYFEKIRMYNKGLNIKALRYSKYAVVNDGAHHFRLRTYYIKPSEQVMQLKKNFKQVSVFFLKNGGQEIVNEADLNKSKDRWLYYLCKL